jgi:hypothetical protein
VIIFAHYIRSQTTVQSDLNDCCQLQLNTSAVAVMHIAFDTDITSCLLLIAAHVSCAVAETKVREAEHLYACDGVLLRGLQWIDAHTHC